jgi:hypothetical protein
MDCGPFINFAFTVIIGFKLYVFEEECIFLQGKILNTGQFLEFHVV